MSNRSKHAPYLRLVKKPTALDEATINAAVAQSTALHLAGEDWTVVTLAHTAELEQALRGRADGFRVSRADRCIQFWCSTEGLSDAGNWHIFLQYPPLRAVRS